MFSSPFIFVTPQHGIISVALCAGCRFVIMHDIKCTDFSLTLCYWDSCAHVQIRWIHVPNVQFGYLVKGLQDFVPNRS